MGGKSLPRIGYLGGLVLFGLLLGTLLLLGIVSCGREYDSGIDWPEPPRVTPGENGVPPSDAVVLFDGTDLSAFTGPIDRWTVRDGYAEAAEGSIWTKRSFGSCQFHIEFQIPLEEDGPWSDRGNSGIFFMGHYELQIFESYGTKNKPDGMAGSIYRQRPPLVNACRPPGRWQSFDVVFTAPEFDEKGQLVRPAEITAFQNGVLILNRFKIEGKTSFREAPRYEPHKRKRPLKIQEHGSAIRFRNIWIRQLEK